MVSLVRQTSDPPRHLGKWLRFLFIEILSGIPNKRPTHMGAPCEPQRITRFFLAHSVQRRLITQQLSLYKVEKLHRHEYVEEVDFSLE